MMAMYQKKKPEWLILVLEISPHPCCLTGFCVAWLFTRLSLQILIQRDFHLQLDIHNNDWLLLTIQHVTIGVVCVISIAFLTITFEKSFLQSLHEMVRHRGKQRTTTKQRIKQD